MSDLRWEDVRSFFDPDLMGPLPDLRVPNTSVSDWQTVLDLVTTSGWQYRYSVGEKAHPLPRATEVLSRPADSECPSLLVQPIPGISVIFRFYAAAEIDCDVALRELQGQQRLDVFCDFLRAIGHRLGKPVLMEPEGNYGHPVLGFDVEAGRVVLLADPQTE